MTLSKLLLPSTSANDFRQKGRGVVLSISSLSSISSTSATSSWYCAERMKATLRTHNTRNKFHVHAVAEVKQKMSKCCAAGKRVTYDQYNTSPMDFVVMVLIYALPSYIIALRIAYSKGCLSLLL